MLILYETAAGFALFKVKDESKLTQPDDLYKYFESSENAHQVVSLEKFKRFKNTAEALKSTTALVDSKMSKTLKKFLTKEIVEKGLQEQLAVSDPKLGASIKEKLQIKCIHDPAVMELYRGIRSQVNNLISELSDHDNNAMSLGLSHSLSRYKLKFSPDKVDTMIVQAISLLDDLDKELNIYAMRVREWYGWHFPELNKIIPDNILFAKTVKKMGNRTSALGTDFSDFLPSEFETELKEAAKTSMGTEISQEDIENICELCDQVISISEYREQLYEYLKNRMNAIAPNLTLIVGELVGARLIAHAGSLLNLAKYPASTVQILGAEKALFRALKTKHETPKYGLIYHASLVGQSAPKNKGKISRVLAAKAALACRYDALGEGETNTEIGKEGREKVEKRLRLLEGGQSHRISGTGKNKQQPEKYNSQTTSAGQPKTSVTYNSSADNTMEVTSPKEKKKKEKKKKTGGNLIRDSPSSRRRKYY
jgi:nucleolar protein 58